MCSQATVQVLLFTFTFTFTLEQSARFRYSIGMTTLTRDEITKLTLAERLTLIGDLWDSMTDAELPTPSPAQHRELEHRLASFDRDKAQAVSWEQLKAELAARTP